MSSQDISCVAYNTIYQHAIDQISQQSAANRTWSRFNGFRNINPLIAIDPSCGGISQNYEEQLLNKKKYIFANNQNNVKSGNTLTKSQIYTRVARGYTPKGTMAPNFGTQSVSYTNSNLFQWNITGNILHLRCPPK